MTREKILDVLFRMLREQLPLMTNNKCKRVAKKVLGILEAYNIITIKETESGSAENTQLSKKP